MWAAGMVGVPLEQAGKRFFRRQKVQDLIALTRVIAGSCDTLALGACCATSWSG